MNQVRAQIKLDILAPKRNLRATELDIVLKQ